MGQIQSRHWTWPLEHLGSWTTLVPGGETVAPALLSATHWTPLAENLGSEEDKKRNCPTPGIVFSFGLFPRHPSSETLDLQVTPAPNPSHAHLSLPCWN